MLLLFSLPCFAKSLVISPVLRLVRFAAVQNHPATGTPKQAEPWLGIFVEALGAYVQRAHLVLELEPVHSLCVDECDRNCRFDKVGSTGIG